MRLHFFYKCWSVRVQVCVNAAVFDKCPYQHDVEEDFRYKVQCPQAVIEKENRNCQFQTGGIIILSDVANAYSLSWRLAFGNVVSGSFKQYCRPPRMLRFKYSTSSIPEVSMLKLKEENRICSLDGSPFDANAYSQRHWHLQLSIAWGQFVENIKESLRTEVPLASGKELQHFQALWDATLNVAHAT